MQYLLSSLYLILLFPCIHSWVYGMQTTLTQTVASNNNKRNLRLFGSLPKLVAVACSGILPEELGAIQQALTFSCQEQMVSFDLDNLQLLHPDSSSLLIGSTGRVILFNLQSSTEEEASDLAISISQELDEILFEFADSTTLQQPILISIDTNKNNQKDRNTLTLAHIIDHQVQEYELKVQLPQAARRHDVPIPTFQIEVDGAMISIPKENGDEKGGKHHKEKQQEIWDTSSILVFDGMVSNELRSRLLQVVNGAEEEADDKIEKWDDVTNGPDPNRWIRGGLLDTPTQEDEEVDRSFGLSEDSIDELCFQHHDAIQDFEMIVTSLLSNFIVTRLPEAVFGSFVSPLTANAPTSEDSNVFNYHIDGDPMQLPPSLWTDVFGRYPNRAPGKPRFMSCLVYLNDEWKDEWGAPTRFLDVATDTPVDIIPKPGRIVLMDQDITHKVTAPHATAGKRPRYSLVWKLILHPREPNQDMKKLCNDGYYWPEPTLIGSAQRD